MLDASHAALRVDSGSVAKAAAPARVPIQIRETANGGITLAGVTEAEVRSKEEMALYLARGSSSRATGSTNINTVNVSYKGMFLYGHFVLFGHYLSSSVGFTTFK